MKKTVKFIIFGFLTSLNLSACSFFNNFTGNSSNNNPSNNDKNSYRLIDSNGILRKEAFSSFGLKYEEGIDDRDPSRLIFSDDGKTATYGHYPRRVLYHEDFNKAFISYFIRNKTSVLDRDKENEKYIIPDNLKCIFVEGYQSKSLTLKQKERELECGITIYNWLNTAENSSYRYLLYLYEPILWDVVKTFDDGKVMLLAHETISNFNENSNFDRAEHGGNYGDSNNRFSILYDFYATAFALGDDYLCRGQWTMNKEDSYSQCEEKYLSDEVLTDPVTLPSYKEIMEYGEKVGLKNARGRLTEYAQIQGASFTAPDASDYAYPKFSDWERMDYAGYLTLRTGSSNQCNFQRLTGLLENYQYNGGNGGIRPIIIVDPNKKIDNVTPLSYPNFEEGDIKISHDKENRTFAAGLFPQDKLTDQSIINALDELYTDDGLTFPAFPKWKKYNGKYYVRNDDENGQRAWYICQSVTWKYIELNCCNSDGDYENGVTAALPTKILCYWNHWKSYNYLMNQITSHYSCYGFTRNNQTNFMIERSSTYSNRINGLVTAYTTNDPHFIDLEDITDYAKAIFHSLKGQGEYSTDTIAYAQTPYGSSSDTYDYEYFHIIGTEAGIIPYQKGDVYPIRPVLYGGNDWAGHYIFNTKDN